MYISPLQVFFSKATYQINSVLVLNPSREYHSENYKQGFQFDKLVNFMQSNLNSDMKKNPLLKIFNSLVDSYRAKKQVSWFGEMELHADQFNLSENAQNTFGGHFEPEMLKYFNICGNILQNQRRWWRSGLLFTERSKSIAQVYDQQSKECEK